jgi:DNA-binding transcriptional LysR family regulator
LQIALAKRGLGLAYTADLIVTREIAAGEFEAVLTSFLPVTPGMFLYFPARTQTQPKLRAFIDALTAFGKRQRAGQK